MLAAHQQEFPVHHLDQGIGRIECAAQRGLSLDVGRQGLACPHQVVQFQS
jgi:hypothetical protein